MRSVTPILRPMWLMFNTLFNTHSIVFFTTWWIWKAEIIGFLPNTPMPSMVPSCCDCINVSNRSWSIQQQKDHSNWTRRLSLPQRIHSLGGHLLYYDPCNTLAMVTQMRSRSGRSPWFLAYDPYIDAVILSIRGTKSLRDVMTSINNRSLFPSFTIRNGSYSE